MSCSKSSRNWAGDSLVRPGFLNLVIPSRVDGEGPRSCNPRSLLEGRRHCNCGLPRSARDDIAERQRRTRLTTAQGSTESRPTNGYQYAKGGGTTSCATVYAMTPSSVRFQFSRYSMSQATRFSMSLLVRKRRYNPCVCWVTMVIDWESKLPSEWLQYQFVDCQNKKLVCQVREQIR